MHHRTNVFDFITLLFAAPGNPVLAGRHTSAAGRLCVASQATAYTYIVQVTTEFSRVSSTVMLIRHDKEAK